MTVYSTQSQINFVIQWFRSWSEIQKDDFIPILAQKLKQIDAAGGEEDVNGIVNGMKGLLGGEDGRPPSLFQCQVKLFMEWWASWSPSDREKVASLIKEDDPSFYQSVEQEMDGTRGKLDNDFMTVLTAGEDNKENDGANGNVNENGVKSPPPVFNVTKVIINSGPSSFTNFVVSSHNGRGSISCDNGNAEQEQNGDGEEEVAPINNGTVEIREESMATEI